MIQTIDKGTAANNKTGTPARQAADMINDNFAYLDAKISNSNHVVTLGTSVLVGQNLTIHAGWVWQINGVSYSNPFDVVINFPFCAAGNQRLDRIVFNTSSTFTKLTGTESVSNPVATPAPADTIEFGITLVTDGTVGDPSTPIEGESFVKKMESQDFIVSLGVTTIVDKINLIDDRSSISLTGAITDVKSLQLTGEFIRPGKPFYIKNRTAHAVKLWHDAGAGNIQFFFPNGLDLTVNPNEVVQFSLNANDSSDYRLEWVGDTPKCETEISYACSDEISDLVVGTLITFRMPFAMTVSKVKLSLNAAPTGSKVIVDIKKNGASIFSTLISVDTSSTTSVGAVVSPVISDSNLVDDSVMTIITTQVGSTIAGKGLKVTFLGKRV